MQITFDSNGNINANGPLNLKAAAIDPEFTGLSDLSSELNRIQTKLIANRHLSLYNLRTTLAQQINLLGSISVEMFTTVQDNEEWMIIGDGADPGKVYLFDSNSQTYQLRQVLNTQFSEAFKGFSINGVDFLVEGVGAVGQNLNIWSYNPTAKNFSVIQQIPGFDFIGNFDFCTPVGVEPTLYVSGGIAIRAYQYNGTFNQVGNNSIGLGTGSVLRCVTIPNSPNSKVIYYDGGTTLHLLNAITLESIGTRVSPFGTLVRMSVISRGSLIYTLLSTDNITLFVWDGNTPFNGTFVRLAQDFGPVSLTGNSLFFLDSKLYSFNGLGLWVWRSTMDRFVQISDYSAFSTPTDLRSVLVHKFQTSGVTYMTIAADASVFVLRLF